MHPRALLRRQRGQAMVEFFVVMLALGVLFALVPLLGKYQDIGHEALIASRYAAWSTTVQNDSDGGGFLSADHLRRDVQRRFMSTVDAPIVTGEGVDGTDAARSRFWVDATGGALVADVSRDVAVTFGPDRAADVLDAFTQDHASQVMFDSTLITTRDFALKNRGFAQANVRVRVADLDAPWLAPFDKLGLAIERSSAVLADPWSARDANSVAHRVARSDTVFPTRALKDINTLALEPLLFAFEDGTIRPPRVGKLDFWQDVVPADRLRDRTQRAAGAP